MTVPVLIAALALVPVPHRAWATAPMSDVAAFKSSTYGTAARLRPQDARTEQWLQAARQRSPTVRRLIDRIEQSDVIVYLDISRRLSPNVAACLTWMAAVPGRRFVRATFRHDLKTEEAIAMVAHELQHVVEVAEHPEVVSNDTLRTLYARIGHATGAGGLRWDTADAVAVGRLARLEAAMPTRPESGGARAGT